MSYFICLKVYQPLYERFIQHAIRAMLSYAPIQDGPVGDNRGGGAGGGGRGDAAAIAKKRH